MKAAALATLGVLALAGCARAGAPVPPTLDDGDAHDDVALPSAPWSGALLPASRAPIVVTEWREAENRATCAPLAPAWTDAAAVARRADFSGGWAVAYDMPELRSAFGVAGTGTSASGDTYDDWPHRIDWEDGSSAGYGPEGGTGPNDLAYLTIPGQGCLYNVWSRFGTAHLEDLLETLRFVDVDGGRR